MKKLRNRILGILSVFILSISFATSVMADTLEKSIIDGSQLSQEKVSTVSIDNIGRGNILNRGTASVGDNGNGTANVYGAVIGSVVCDKMILELTLQRYSNGAWVNVKSFSDTAYNTSLLTKSYNVKVTKGYYYRVKAACIAQKNGVSESRMPVTNGVLVD